MTANRRQFLAASTATVASLSARAADEKPFRIDCQSHLYSPELVALMEKRTTDPAVYRKGDGRWVKMGDWHRRVLPNHMDVEGKIKTMDANGIELTALSINDPGPEWFGEQGAEVARIANDFVAGVVKEHPKRFFGLCVLPLQDMKASLAELDRCVNKLGMKGILLYTNLAGKFPDRAEFRPLFARAVELDVPVLLHPAKPMTSDLLKEYDLISGLGNMFDNTIALTRLIVSGVLDRHPDLKLVCPHLGGTLPYIVGRLDHQMTVLKRGPRTLKKAPSEYLKQIYYDIVSPLPLAMKFAHEFVGPDKLLFSSDHPWVDPGLIIGHFQSLKLPAADERKIFRDNARKLFRL